MRIIRYLKHSKAAVFLIAILLVIQAFADLSLPRYTSDIVDVGIQQSGIEHASPEAMRASTFDSACMLSPEDDEAVLRMSYAPSESGEAGATWELTDYGREHREALDAILALPMVIVSEAQASSDDDFAALTEAYAAGAVRKADVLALADEAKSQLGGASDDIVAQQAIQAVKAEYDALGIDVPAIQMSYLVSVGLQMLGVAAIMMVVSIAVGFLASRTAARIAASLRERLFERVVTFSDAEIQAFSAASLITRGTNDIQQIQMVIVMLLRMVLYAPILAAGGIIMVARTDVSMSWIIVLAVAVIFVVLIVLMKVAMPKFKIMQTLIDRVNLVSREILTGLPVIRAFDRQAYEEARFDEASTALMGTQLFTNRVMTFMMPTMMLVMNGVSVLIVWVGGANIDAGTLQTGDMIAFITYSMVIIMSFLMLGMISIMLPRADVAAQRVNEVLEAKASIEDPENPRAAARPQTPSCGARIEFDDVTFAYDEGSEPVLEHISFVAEPGKTTAIIGPTGSGKSTIMKLIERFYDVTSGSIRLNGVDIRSMTQHDLRAELGYVPQKAFLFSGTIQSAIACDDASIDASRIRQAADIAQAREFIESKPDGLEAPVSQGGTNVSGGQRQRLAIARALATEASAFLFDDSFSALDYKTDAAVRAALGEHLGGKTVIIVAQRISTVLDADTIIVLEDGHMVGCGSHAQLMETCPLYREIAESQLSAEELAAHARSCASDPESEPALRASERRLRAEGEGCAGLVPTAAAQGGDAR